MKEINTWNYIRMNILYSVSLQLWNTYHKSELVQQGLRKTLADLGLKHLDLYLMHWPFAFKVNLIQRGHFKCWPLRPESDGVSATESTYIHTHKFSVRTRQVNTKKSQIHNIVMYVGFTWLIYIYIYEDTQVLTWN